MSERSSSSWLPGFVDGVRRAFSSSSPTPTTTADANHGNSNSSAANAKKSSSPTGSTTTKDDNKGLAPGKDGPGNDEVEVAHSGPESKPDDGKGRDGAEPPAAAPIRPLPLAPVIPPSSAATTLPSALTYPPPPASAAAPISATNDRCTETGRLWNDAVVVDTTVSKPVAEKAESGVARRNVAENGTEGSSSAATATATETATAIATASTGTPPAGVHHGSALHSPPAPSSAAAVPAAPVASSISSTGVAKARAVAKRHVAKPHRPAGRGTAVGTLDVVFIDDQFVVACDKRFPGNAAYWNVVTWRGTALGRDTPRGEIPDEAIFDASAEDIVRQLQLSGGRFLLWRAPPPPNGRYAPGTYHPLPKVDALRRVGAALRSVARIAAATASQEPPPPPRPKSFPQYLPLAPHYLPPAVSQQVPVPQNVPTVSAAATAAVAAQANKNIAPKHYPVPQQVPVNTASGVAAVAKIVPPPIAGPVPKTGTAYSLAATATTNVIPAVNFVPASNHLLVPKQVPVNTAAGGAATAKIVPAPIPAPGAKTGTACSQAAAAPITVPVPKTGTVYSHAATPNASTTPAAKRSVPAPITVPVSKTGTSYSHAATADATLATKRSVPASIPAPAPKTGTAFSYPATTTAAATPAATTSVPASIPVPVPNTGTAYSHTATATANATLAAKRSVPASIPVPVPNTGTAYSHTATATANATPAAKSIPAPITVPVPKTCTAHSPMGTATPTYSPAAVATTASATATTDSILRVTPLKRRRPSPEPPAHRSSRRPPWKVPTVSQLAAAIPTDASSVAHIFDRRVNLDTAAGGAPVAVNDTKPQDPHRRDPSLYTLLRAWVQDDPQRVVLRGDLREYETVPLATPTIPAPPPPKEALPSQTPTTPLATPAPPTDLWSLLRGQNSQESAHPLDPHATAGSPPNPAKLLADQTRRWRHQRQSHVSRYRARDAHVVQRLKERTGIDLGPMVCRAENGTLDDRSRTTANAAQGAAVAAAPPATVSPVVQAATGGVR